MTCPFSSISKISPKEIRGLALRLLVVPHLEVSKYLLVQKDTLERAYATGDRNQTSIEAFIKGAHFIDNFNVAITQTAEGNPDQACISFMLTKDNSLSALDGVFPVSLRGGLTPFNGSLILLKDYKKTVIKSSISDQFYPGLSSLSLKEPPAEGLHVVKCVEMETGYELSINVQGLNIKKIEGNLKINHFFFNKEISCLFFYSFYRT